MSRKVFTGTIIVLLCAISLPTYAQGIFDQTADWAGQGDFKAEGSASFSGGTYTLEGNGDDIWNETDEGFFLYTEAEGNNAIEGKVDWVDPGANEWSKIGVMVRDLGDAPDSKHYWAMMRGLEDLSGAQWRPTEAGGSSSSNFQSDGANVGDPGDGIYLRVTRIAELDLCFSEWSLDGSEWNVGHAAIVDMDDPVAYGLAITDHEDDETVAVAEVEDVELGDPQAVAAYRQIDNPDVIFTQGESITVRVLVGGAPGAVTVTETPPPGWEISDISGGGTAADGVITWDLSSFDGAEELSYVITTPDDADADVAISGDVGGVGTFGGDIIPAPQPIGIFDNHMDIGAVDAEGDAELDGDTYYVVGSGADIWGGADEFHFVYNKMSGSFVIRSEEVIEFGGDLMGASPSGNDWQKSGLMVRDNLTPGSPHFNQIVRSSNLEMRAQWRNDQNGVSEGGDGSETSTDIQAGYMEIVKIGNTFSAYTVDYNTGERIQIYTYTNENIQDPVYVGLAVTSHEDGNFTTGEFHNVEIEQIPFTASRVISDTYFTAGSTIDVEVTVEPAPGETTNAELTENIPEGFTVSGVEVTNGSTDLSGNTLVWNLDSAAELATMSYTLTAPDPAPLYAELTGTTLEGEWDLSHGSDFLMHEPGLGPDWVIGSQAGAWAIQDGVLKHFSTNGHDPKHVWVDMEMADGNYTVKCDVRITTWPEEAADLARAGVAIRINPDDNGANPGSDRGLNLLFHNDTESVDILNDLVTWGEQPTVPWEVGTWYTMALSGDGNVLEAFFMEADAGGDIFADGFLTVWEDAGNEARSPGFPGLTGNTLQGYSAEFDNFEVIVDDEVVFSADFDEPQDVSNWALY